MKYTFLIATISCISCLSIPKNNHTATPSSLSEDYYLQFQRSEERLAHLLTGHFACYSIRKQAYWKVNDGADSLIAINKLVGDVNKEGHYLIYREVIMTHIPDKPLSQHLIKLKRISPDTILGITYEFKNPDAYVGWKNRAVNWEGMQQNDCIRTYTKVAQTKFVGNTNFCDAPPSKSTNIGAKYRVTDIDIQPAGYRVNGKSYTEKNGPLLHNTILEYRRFSINHS